MTDSVVELSAENFDEETSAGLWLVDFWAAWCGPCRGLEPVLHDLADDNRAVRVGKLEVTDHPMVAERFSVKSLPTLVILKDGVVVDRMFGVKTRRQLDIALSDVVD